MEVLEKQKEEKNPVIKIHIFVELTKHDVRKIEFDTNKVTGVQIKEKAGAPLNSDLGKKEHGKIIHVPDNQTIEIKEGDHFVVLPSGTIS
jgi:hypothetical protein